MAQSVAPSSERNLGDQEASLALRARRKGLIFGAAELHDFLIDNAEYQAAFLRDCDLLVPMNELKFYDLRPTSPDFDFTAADWMVSFASSNHLLLRGHTLVWGLAFPPWAKLVPPGRDAERLLVDHIWAVAGRYRGLVHSWDVVNEAIEPYDGRPDFLRKSYWLNALGEDYIELAFRTAAEADPHALLCYNDYQLERIGAYDNQRREGTLKLLDKLVSKGVPIHAVGIQSHLPPNRNWFAEKEFMSFLDSVHRMGLRTIISEFEVGEESLPLDIAERDALVAQIAEDFLTPVLTHPSLSMVVTWGLSDRYTYRITYSPRSDGFPPRPLPIDAAFQRKPLWWAMARALDNAPGRAPLLGPLVTNPPGSQNSPG